MIMEEARKEIADFGRKMSSSGLSKGTSGNISIYDPQLGYMAISPSGVGYFETEPEDVVVMDLEGNVIEGTRKPSSEYGLHIVMYKAKPEARGVVHAHSTYCTTFACLNEPLTAVHYAIASSGVATVPVVPYATFGTPELAKNVENTLKNNDSKAVLLQNHGVVTSGPSLETAFGLATSLEFVGEILWRAKSVGAPVIIDDEEIARVVEEFRAYGQPKKDTEKKDGIGY